MTESLQATDVNGLLAKRANAMAKRANTMAKCANAMAKCANEMAKRAKTRWLCPHLLNDRSADATTTTLPVL